MPIDMIDLAKAMGEIELALVAIDAMLRHEGYTQNVKNAMEDVHALAKQIKILAEEKGE